ncbi:flagellar hook-basal body complex protein FliE [Plastorhodobacter daqingensis]|uniref:Flagellar hook-basal body complex protein FliE n=1 Tax=Plastorhodobacter daqingensis TaxID=1387281 RepID=A0ABW2UN21_9RHOB
MTSISSPSLSLGQLHQTLQQRQATPQTTPSQSFGDRMQGSLRSVADAQASAAASARDYELGLENDLSRVMISQQVASLGFQMALNVRNKALTAYKDIMNMPV